MLAQDPIAKLRAAYRRWNDTKGQSVADWIDLMTDDVKVRSVADGAEGMRFSAPRDGKAAAREYFAVLATEWEMVYHAADEFIVDSDGERVVVFGRCAFKHRGTGKAVESPFAHRWRIRDGRIAEYFEIYDTAKAFAAARPDPA
jgi:ketosteroid isomerase-like protein